MGTEGYGQGGVVRECDGKTGDFQRRSPEAVAEQFGVEIPETQFEVVKGKRGRPKKDSTASSSDDEDVKAEASSWSSEELPRRS